MNPNSKSPAALSKSASPSAEGIPTSTVRLEIKGLGHVPSFKNNKSIFRNQKGKPFIATKPIRKKWMEQATHLIELQLLSASQTAMPEILTAQSLRSWIASVMPLDDSWQWVNELHIKTVKVPKGEEGAYIVIERL